MSSGKLHSIRSSYPAQASRARLGNRSRAGQHQNTNVVASLALAELARWFAAMPDKELHKEPQLSPCPASPERASGRSEPLF